jgi:hypothetical protein
MPLKLLSYFGAILMKVFFGKIGFGEVLTPFLGLIPESFCSLILEKSVYFN